MAGVHLEQGNIGKRVGPDDLCGQFAAIGQPYVDRARIRDDVSIGDDVAVGANDESGAQSGGRSLIGAAVSAGAGQKPSNEFADCVGIGVGIRAFGRALAGADALFFHHDRDHTGCDAPHQRGVTGLRGVIGGAEWCAHQCHEG
jgi:hypothetical protein